MELFSLLAKLTLDTKEYDSAVSDVERQKIEIEDPRLELDKDDYSSGIDEATSEADQFSQSAMDSFSAVKTALVATGIVAVLTQITNLFKQAIDQTVETADAIDKGSRRMNITTKQYQMWNHALEQSGGNIGDLNRGLMNFRSISSSANDLTSEEIKLLDDLNIDYKHGQTRLELYTKAKEKLAGVGTEEEQKKNLEAISSLMGDNINLTDDQINAFRQLQIEVKKENGELKSSDELMMETMDALAAMTDIDARDSIVDKLFGRNSGGIKPLLDAGVDGMHQLLEESEKLGLIMSDTEIQNAVAYGDAVANLKNELDAVKSAFVADVIPVLTDAVKGVTEIIAAFNPRVTDTLAERWIGEDEEFAKKITEISKTSETAQTMVDKLIEMGDTSKMTAEEYAVWEETARRIIGLVPELGDVIDVESGKINANSEEIKENIKQWERLAKEKAMQEVKEEKLGELAKKNKDLASKTVDLEMKRDEEEASRKKSISGMNEVLEKYNKILESNGRKTLSLVGDDVTEEEMVQKAQELARAMDGLTDSFGNELGLNASKELADAKSAWSIATHNAEQAQKKYDDLNKEIAEAQESYEKWLAAYDRILNEQGKDIESDTQAVNDLKAALDKLPSEKRVELMVSSMDGLKFWNHNAKGLWDVPYDDYPTLLHRDEMVLSASRARKYREGGSQIDYSQLENALITAIEKGMDHAQVNAYIDKRDVTDAVSRELANQLNGRRYG